MKSLKNAPLFYCLILPVFFLGCSPGVNRSASSVIADDNTPDDSSQTAELEVNPASAQISPEALQEFATRGGVPPYQFEIYSGEGSIDRSTGKFRAPASNGVTVIRIQDAIGATVYATISSRDTPTIYPTSVVLAQGNSLPFSVSGGLGPYTFSLVSGHATLDPVTGQFTATVANSVKVRVRDSLGRFADSAVTVNPPLVISPKTITKTFGGSLSFSSSGGVPPYRFKVLAGSGNIDPSSGAYVAPYVAGFDVVQVEDAFGNSDSGMITLNSNLSLSPNAFFLAQGTSIMMIPSGGIPPYSFSANVGHIEPSGLFTAPGNSGGPYFVTVTDSVGTTALSSVDIFPSLSFSVQNITLPVNGTFNFSAITSGGVGPKTFVAQSSQGSFSGTTYTAPSSPGTYLVNVYDSQAPSPNSATAQITVTPSLNLTPSSATLAVTNVERFSVSGGVPPYVFALQSGSGRIEADGTYTAGDNPGPVVIQVLDSYGTVVTSSLTLVPELKIIPVSKVMNTESTFQFTASGGVGEKTYKILSGIGSIDPSSGSFTSSAAEGNSTVRVMDERGNQRQASVKMVSPLQLSPSQIPVLVGTTFPLISSGGATPYTFSLIGEGSVDAQGVFTAPGTAGSSTVQVTDSIGNTQTSVITVYDGLLISPFAKTLIFNQTLSLQASGGVTPYSYQLLSGVGSVNSTSGIYSAPSVAGSAVVQVTDALGKTSQANLTIQPPLAISPTTKSLAINNPTRFSASGGIPPYAYQLTSGSGILSSGTGDYVAPSLAGSARIQVTDSGGNTAIASVTIQPALGLNPSLADLVQSSHLTFSPVGGVAPYTFSMTSGVGSMSPTTGEYSAPSSAGSAVVRVTDSLGNFSEAPVQIYSLLNLSPSSRTLSIENQTSFTASGGKLPYTYSVTGGGSFTGGVYIPASAGSATVQVTDALGQTRQSTVTITQKLAISPSSATLNAAASQTFTASGGVGPYTYSLYSGLGDISGATYTGPATNGSLSIVRVTDSLGNTADAAITVRDQIPSDLAYSVNPATYTRSENIAITDNRPSHAGGAVLYYSISPTLPGGLSFDTTTGVISGIPSEISDTTSYTITATNSGGSTTVSLSITVNDVAPSNLVYSSNPVVYPSGIPITENSPSPSGGAVKTYSVSPSLPSGLSLNTTSGVISGTPTSVTAATSYTVTANNSGGSTTASLSIAVVGSAAKLAFISSPGGKSYVSMNDFNPAITVAVQDSLGTTVPTSTASITLNLVNNPASGTLSGNTQSAANGIATFSNLKLNKAAANYTLNASSSGLTNAPTSAAFTITTGPASKMVFSTSIAAAFIRACTGPYWLTVQDSGGNAISNSSGSSWNIPLSQNGSASLYGSSDCSDSISQVSVSSGQSDSSPFYIKDNVLETLTLTANGTNVSLGTATSPVQVVTGKRIYVTSNTYTGDMLTQANNLITAGSIAGPAVSTGIAGADKICEYNFPTPTTSPSPSVYPTTKAFLVDSSSRNACTVAFCGSGNNPVGWVLSPNTPYYRPDGTFIGTTNGNGIFYNGTSSGLTNSIQAVGHSIWTGFSNGADWTAASSLFCGISSAKWTSSSSSDTGNTASSSAKNGGVAYSAGLTCNNQLPIYCIEQ